MKISSQYFFILFSFLYTQNIYTEYLVSENDTLDIFSYQIPENYNPNISHPLLVTFHQWGGNQNSNYSTEFDEEANNRNWIMLSPYGGSANNYNHQGAQFMVEQEILWIQNNFNINTEQIYMVGGSMGGAAGAIYANNHLDPTKPMVAATASASGILDCERRAIEMDGNNSMIEWFGGNWDEVPFEYHRNSAVYFADSTQSMHYNLQYTPLYLDFGVTEPHRTHAEDLFNLLLDYNNQMWIDTEPTGSHGYTVFNENHVCNWLSQFDLINNPENFIVNLDEPSRAYWIEAYNIYNENNFIKLDVGIEEIWINTPDGGEGNHIEIEANSVLINEYTNSDSLIVHAFDNQSFFNLGLTNNIFQVGIKASPYMYNIKGFSGSLFNGYNLTHIYKAFGPCHINYTIDNNIIWITLTNDYFSNEPCSNIDEDIIINFEFNNIYDDINQDGIWNVIDVILIMNHILSINPLTNSQIIYADLNNDNIIDILDIINLVNIILSN